MNRTWLVLSLTLTLAACGGESPAPTPAEGGAAPAKKAAAKGLEAAPKAEEAPKAEAAPAAAKHPWGSFKPGSYAKLKSTTVMTIAGNKTETVTEMTYTLAEVTADKAVLDLETKMAALPTPTKTRTEIPLTGTGAVATPTAAPDAPKPVEGSEDVTVNGKTLKCKTIEMTIDANGTKTTTKSWMSEEVPGFAVKSVTKMEGATPTETTMELVDYKAM